MPNEKPSTKPAAPADGQTESHGRIVTGRAELERQLRQSEENIVQLGVQARKIAHDLNNVLTGIVGYHELIIELLPPDDQARHFLTEARNSCLRARTLVERLGTLANKDETTPP
jgi:two-component system cell cycle sensor histidine kinase/response regulator CckA